MTNAIQLAIAIVAGAVRLTATVPGPGQWWVLSRDPGQCCLARVEASGRATNAVHIAVRVRRDETARVFWVRFEPDARANEKR